MSGEGKLTSFLLQILKEQVTEYIKLKSGAKDEFEKLNNELHLLQAFIVDSDKISEKTEVYKVKLREIRELVYDVEDTIETCLTKKAAAKRMNFILRLPRKLSNSMEKKIKALREGRVQPIIQDINQEFGEITVDDGSAVDNGSAVENSLTEVKK